MTDPGDAGFEGEAPDPDAMLWVRGVDYVEGWRDAKNAAAELREALEAAGIDPAGIRAQADADAEGSGVVRLRLPASVVREVARRVQGCPAWREAG